MTKHTILFLAADPHGTDRGRPDPQARRVALDQEASAIRKELKLSGHGDRFELVTRWAAEPYDLLRELRALKPTVVHFSGHGDRDGLFFQAPNGDARLVSPAAIAETFGAAGGSVKLVVLSACYGETAAEALLAHVDCVVGMSGVLRDDMARAFATGFYGALGEQESVAAAYKHGNAAISLDGLADTDRPQLKVRAGIDAARIVLAAGGSASAPVTFVASTDVNERLRYMKREITATLKVRPRPFAQLAARIGCGPEVLSDRLVDLRGSVVAEHVLAVYDAQPPTPEGDADRDALQSVLFTVLPYVSDWRDEVASCCARGDGQAGVVELRYRSDTIAEAVMAGWVGRRCLFEYKAGAEPHGVGAVQIPATSQTALFTSEQHLLDGVVKQLMYQLGVGGLNPHEQRTRVQAALRRRDRVGHERMRYYFLFRDAASPEDPGGLWRLARTTLHGEAGLPGLALVRMQGYLDDDEAYLEECIAAMLKPRTPIAIVSGPA